MLKYFDEGNQKEFFRLWLEHVPSGTVASDPSLKSLEFLLYAHFAVYFLRSTCPIKVNTRVPISIEYFDLFTLERTSSAR
jgi:hypothetical protein